MTRRLRAGLMVAAWFAGGVLAVSLLIVGGSIARGGRVLVVASGSMAPAIRTGDLVVSAAVPARKVRVGQVVTFRDPTRGNRLVSHRVRTVALKDGKAEIVTKGDRNDAVERWSVPSTGRVGLVRWRVPSIGFVIARLRSRPGQIGFVGLPALLLGLTETMALWRRRPEAEQVVDRKPAPDPVLAPTPVRPSMFVVDLEPAVPRHPGWDDVLGDLADRIEVVFGAAQRVVMVDEARYTITLDPDVDGDASSELSRRLRAVLNAPLVGRDIGPVDARVREAVPA